MISEYIGGMNTVNFEPVFGARSQYVGIEIEYF